MPGTVVGYDDWWVIPCANGGGHPCDSGEGRAHKEVAEAYGVEFLCLAGPCARRRPEAAAAGRLSDGGANGTAAGREQARGQVEEEEEEDEKKERAAGGGGGGEGGGGTAPCDPFDTWGPLFLVAAVGSERPSTGFEMDAADMRAFHQTSELCRAQRAVNKDKFKVKKGAVAAARV